MAKYLNNAIARYRAMGEDLMGRADELDNAPADYAAFQTLAKQRRGEADTSMLNALAAQFAGEDFQPVQAQFLKRAMAAQEPVKIGNYGYVGNDGQVVIDPMYQREKTIDNLRRRAISFEQLATNAETAAEKRAADAQYRDTMATIAGYNAQTQRLFADAKTQGNGKLRADGATDVNIAISALRDAYDRLEKGGGITSENNSALSNVPAFLSSTAPGQVLGKAVGSKNQSARNDIAMTRPALLAALMKATGMNARQMDSNAELKLWLATATDPTLDVESNRRALANIERKYLNGGAAEAAMPEDSSGGLTPEEQAELQDLRRRLKR